MGTGKTTVGQEVARRLGRPFVDMDAEIETRAGKSIPQIFAEDGEAAFRQIETALCEELSARQGVVIATGGGALVNPANRALMLKSSTVVCLNCEVDEILRRLGEEGDPDRPLLYVADPRAEVERLLEVRHEAYQSIPWQIDTTGVSVEEIAGQVIELAGVITLPVHYPGGRYPIHIGDGLLTHIGEALRAAGVLDGGRVAVVSNPVVAPLYSAQVETALQSVGFQPFSCTIPDGEPHKTLSTVSALYDQFLAVGLDRSSTVLSLGGGVTGDVAGFAAATFMRGVCFVQVPTTLLAMVDASVGGKTGVDLPQGKNLVGAFKQPATVVIDPTVLATLPAEEFRSGMAEVIKHGIIGAPELFAELETQSNHQPLTSFAPLGQTSSPAIPSRHIAQALRVKIMVVEEDPFERGRRAVLNLGHTVGHALECLSDFTLRHGEAVAIGMVAAARVAAELDLAAPSLAERIEAVLTTWGLPVQCPANLGVNFVTQNFVTQNFAHPELRSPGSEAASSLGASAIWEAMQHDKKRRGKHLRWILPRAIGQVEIVEDVPPETVMSVLQDIGAR
jgi:3-dehydroquinate synthase